jgi:hypothetical protein
LILSLGIGVNLGAFQLLDTLFWRPLQIRDPASLVRFDWDSRNGGGTTVPYPLTQFVRENSAVLSAVLVRADASDAGGVIWGDDAGNRLKASFVSAVGLMSWITGRHWVEYFSRESTMRLMRSPAR